MQIYLLAANLFSLAALLLALGGGSRAILGVRLLPLFLLVIGRSLALLILLARPQHDPMVATYGIGALEVFSTFCLMWTLTGSTSLLPQPWPKLAWLGAAGALSLSFLSLLPIWPVPPQIHSLTIAVLGTPFILMRLERVPWAHLSPPLLLALANFFDLLGLTSIFWLINLLAYAFFINALHRESIQAFYQIYRERQQATEASIQRAINLSREQQRWFEVSEIINNAPNLNHAMEHIAQSMAHITHADQSAIFMVDSHIKERVRLVILYSPERPVHITGQHGITFNLMNCPPLYEAIKSQQQLLLPQPKPNRQNTNGLNKLYALWHEDRLGPTLIQPLVVQGQAVGAFMLGNPVTNRPIRQSDVRLCQALAGQIAMLVEHRRRYLELEAQAEAMVAAQQRQLKKVTSLNLPESRGNFDFEEPGLPWGSTTAGALEERWDTLNLDELEARWEQETPHESAQAPARPNPELTRTGTVTSEPKQANDLEAYLAIFQAISNGVVVSDATGRVKLANRAAERILGKPARQLIGQPIATIYGQIDAREPIEDLAVAFSRRNQPLPTFVETGERAIQGKLIPWRNDEQEWLGIIAVFSDVTREVKADRARNDFIAALSHELRAPLTVVKGYSELITNGAISNYTPEQLHVQQLIHSSAERMVEVLDNAIQITAENRHQLLPRFEETDVAKIIHQVLHEMSPLAELSELSLAHDIKPDLPQISVDPRHLHRILENLLSNACRFTPPGGSITVRAWVQSEREGNSTRRYVLLAVVDNGIGIPSSELKRIFDPFYQLNNQNLEQSSGMGMGLAVVKELVELHNGRVWAESMPGEGSIFQVALPLAQES